MNAYRETIEVKSHFIFLEFMKENVLLVPTEEICQRDLYTEYVEWFGMKKRSGKISGNILSLSEIVFKKRICDLMMYHAYITEHRRRYGDKKIRIWRGITTRNKLRQKLIAGGLTDEQTLKFKIEHYLGVY